MKRRKILIADLLCGAGGTTTGARKAMLGLSFTEEEFEFVCVNHWGVAIETHRKNHPYARHYLQDIATARPHLLVPEGYLDLLMASPTCTHHSAARGGKPTSDQQRSDPWHIITWLTELRVKRLLIENVPEFVSWGPVDPRTKRPIKSRKGEYFRSWTRAIQDLGFVLEWKILNAADFGDATTRRRFFLQARSDGKPIAWPQPTHQKRTDGLALFPTAKPWRPAREIIDWQIKGRSIFGRKKPLSPKTLARIYAGAVKFKWPEPFLVVLRNHMAGQSVDGPLPTVAANGTHIGLAEPVILSTQNSGRPRSIEEPMPTITTGGAGSKRQGCARPMLVRPFMLSQASGGAPRETDQPVPAIPCDGAHALISPYYGSGSGETCKSTDQPLDTVPTKGRFGLVVPVTNSNGGPEPRDLETPLPTMTTAKGGEFAMVTPVTHAGGEDRAQDVTDPLPTVTGANRGELAFITAAFGEREGQAPRVHDIAEPAPTITAQGRINLAVVELTETYDILFRMLEPHELAAAMGFNSDDQQYEFAGTKTDKIKQIGNAVPVGTATALVRAAMADSARPPKPSPAAAKSEAA